MNLSIILSQMTQLFLLIFLGFFLYKVHILSKSLNQGLTKLILHVTLPFMIFSSVLEQANRPPVVEVLSVFLIAIILNFLMPFFCLLVIKLLRFPKAEQGLYAFMCAFSNIGFMGFPILNALYGETGLFYGGIFNIIFNLSIFTVGIYLMNYGTEKKAAIQLKSLFTPGIILSSLSVIVYFLNIPFPSVLVETISDLGSITSPCAMLLIGSTLATMDLKSIFSNRRIYVFSILKQFLLPLILFPLFRFFIKNEFLLGLSFVLYLMPTANTAVLFATNYGKDEKLAAKGVFITTVFSMISVPLLLSLLL